MKGYRGPVAIFLCIILIFAGCLEFRGMPTHGGGKRFSEEQRAVAGAVRRAVADMDLKELKGHPVFVISQSMATSGGGATTYPGLSSLSGYYSSSLTDSKTNYIRTPTPTVTPLAYSYFMDSGADTNTNSYNASATINPMFSYNATTYPTDQDVTYLTSVLTMKIQHAGALFVPAGQKYNLYVLIDVLGLNRSRRDSFVFWSDKLQADCEITYYAIDVATNQFLFKARHTSASASYNEYSALLLNGLVKSHDIKRTPSTPLAVDGDEANWMTEQDKPTTATLAIKADQTKTSDTLKLSVGQYLDTQLMNAQLQVQVGNYDEAKRLINLVRAVDPNHPGLSAIEMQIYKKKWLP